ncbi:hypothetical protein yrohd0001_27660 [Yersinia rohdei ATCC 43380]|nr:hypothetical protein yrohd0001_27660 [Yersinia rohdei ATCC 43380]
MVIMLPPSYYSAIFSIINKKQPFKFPTLYSKRPIMLVIK